jgi:hypothetical protein
VRVLKDGVHGRAGDVFVLSTSAARSEIAAGNLEEVVEAEAPAASE